MTELVGVGWVKRFEYFVKLNAMLHLLKMIFLNVKPLYYHISLKLDRLKPNQFIILSCHALLCM